VSNTQQLDLDDDGTGDACDLATCGNGIREHTELCETDDTVQCGSNPCEGCFCECDTAGQDPKAKVKVTTRRDAGKLAVTLKANLGTFTGDEAISVRLSDTDTPVIAEQAFDGLPAQGKRVPPNKWQYKSKEPGIQKLRITAMKRVPGQYKIVLKAKEWFSAAEADQPMEDTRLYMTIGGINCVSLPVTKKRD
jgi:hypothetical protein